MPIIIDGKQTSAEIKELLKKAIEQSSIKPKLVVVLVGDDPASATYVRNKEKACDALGIAQETYRLPASTTQDELLSLIHKLNNDNSIHGILIQIPLPKQIDERAVLVAINPDKDVDCFHPSNVGKVVLGQAALLPCTPAGIMVLLKRYGIDPQGKEAVIVGRSNIVGKPTALLLLAKNATVTIAHSRTTNLTEVTKRADILIVAVGKANLITADMVKPGAVVIDVGQNWKETSEGRKVDGDVDYAQVFEKTYAITPVPGGVGPMTIAMLAHNVCIAAGISVPTIL